MRRYFLQKTAGHREAFFAEAIFSDASDSFGKSARRDNFLEMPQKISAAKFLCALPEFDRRAVPCAPPEIRDTRRR